MFFKSPDAEVTEQNSAKTRHVFIGTKTKLLSASVTFLTPLNPLLPASCCLSSTVGPCLSLSLLPSLSLYLSRPLPRGRSRPRLEALLPLCFLCYFCLGPLCAANQPWGHAQPRVCVCECACVCVCVCPLPSLRSHTGRPAWEVSAALHHPLHHHHLTPPLAVHHSLPPPILISPTLGPATILK